MLSARPLLAVAFALVVTLGAVGASPSPAAAADLTLEAAELEMVRLLNAERARHGLISVRVDARLMSIARQRSAHMARYHYFSHVQPDGRDVFDLLNAARITWYAAGEIIAWNTSASFAESVTRARDGWLASAGHRAIVLSRDFNYFGIGLAVDAVTGRKLWTGVFMKGPDRTGAYARFGTAPRISIPSTARYQDVVVTWNGNDVQLVTLTAGFRHFQLRVRTDGGPWTLWSSATTSKSRTVRVWRGHDYDVQVRACDRVINCGGWATLRLQA